MLVHEDDPTEAVGTICSRCKMQLIESQRTENRCGECEQFASYGTQELQQLRDAGDAMPSESVRVMEHRLLCEEHYEESVGG
jgi:Zn finger protein HypA/HybF involved in hydrogenase expression